MVNVTVKIGWKFIVALGAAVGITILTSKLDGSSAERVLAQTVNTSKGNVNVLSSVD